MNNEIKKIEESLDYAQEFIFSLRKFLRVNPEIAARYAEFMGRKEKIIY